MMRRYSCNKYKNYSIRSHYFVNGLFQTDDPSVQQLIENADGYGVFIHPVESPEEIEQMKAAEEAAAAAAEHPGSDEVIIEEQPPVAVQGARGTASGLKSVRKGQVIGAKK